MRVVTVLLLISSVCTNILLGVIIWLHVNATSDASEKAKEKSLEYQGAIDNAHKENKWQTLSKILDIPIEYNENTGYVQIYNNAKIDSTSVKFWQQKLALIKMYIYDYAMRNRIKLNGIRVLPKLQMLEAQ